MAAEIAERAAAACRGRRQPPREGGLGRGQIVLEVSAVEVQEAPERALVDEAPGLAHQRRAQIGEPDRIDDAGRGGRVGERLGFFAREADRFLAQEGLPLRDRAVGDLGMGVAGDRDDDRVGGVHRLAPVRGRAGESERGGGALGLARRFVGQNVRLGFDRTIGKHGVHGANGEPVRAADKACADQCDPDRPPHWTMSSLGTWNPRLNACRRVIRHPGSSRLWVGFLWPLFRAGGPPRIRGRFPRSDCILPADVAL